MYLGQRSRLRVPAYRARTADLTAERTDVRTPAFTVALTAALTLGLTAALTVALTAGRTAGEKVEAWGVARMALFTADRWLIKDFF